MLPCCKAGKAAHNVYAVRLQKCGIIGRLFVLFSLHACRHFGPSVIAYLNNVYHHIIISSYQSVLREILFLLGGWEIGRLGDWEHDFHLSEIVYSPFLFRGLHVPCCHLACITQLLLILSEWTIVHVFLSDPLPLTLALEIPSFAH